MSSTNNSKGAWVRLPLDLLQQHGVLQSDAVLLALIIDRCIDKPSKAAALDRSKLAAAAGCSVRSVSYGVQRLEQLGLIKRVRTGRQSYYALTGAVELLPPKGAALAADPVPDPAAQPRRTRRHVQQRCTSDMDAAYLACVNKFRRDAGDDEPLEGQLTWEEVAQDA